MQKPNYISLDSLAGGGLSERINRELAKVAENILDPNTKADAVRTLTVKIKIKPNKQRQAGDVELVVDSSLVPADGLPSMFVFDYDNEGNAVMKEMQTGTDPNQLQYTPEKGITDGVGEPVNKKVVNGVFR